MKHSKKTIKYVSLISLAALLFGGLAGISLLTNAVNEAKGEADTPSETYTTGDAATYYNSIDDTKSGNALLSDLRALNLSKRQKTIGYKPTGTTPAGYFRYTDYDPDYVENDANGQPYGTRISSFYTYSSASNWNREHVWPDSHGGNTVEDDIHMPRPTISSENSSRGNSFFVEGMNHSSNGWDPLTAGYSANSRGEAARITFYCMTVNGNLSIAPSNTAPSGTDPVTGNTYSSSKTMGNLETLIKWNIEYPVTQREMNRNEGAEYLQGNRNAFIDHREYACKIWGNVNSKIKNMCDNANWETPVGISISKSEASISVDNTTTISATATDSSEISWYSSDEQVVEVSSEKSQSGANVTLTGIGPGTATVTATATINNTEYTANCAVTVTSSGGGGGDIPSPSDSYIIVNTDLPSSYPTTATTYTAESGIKFSAFNVMNQSGKVQFKKNGGYLYNNEELNLASLTLSGASGTLTVYGGTSKNPSESAISGTNGVYNLSGYKYFKIINSSGSVASCTSITVSLASSSTKTLESIAVKTNPTKTSYTAGETFNPSGLVITATYDDDSTEDISYASASSAFTFNPSTITALTTSNTSVTITYKEKSTTLPITVSKAVELTSITLGGDYPTEFSKGGTFSHEGIIITAHYDDNTFKDVTSSATFTGYNMSTAGAQTITVSYTEGGITKYANYQITVVEPVATSITATLINSSKVYHPGESIQKSDLTVEDNLENAITDFEIDSALVTYKDAPSGGSTGTKQLTITAGNLSTTVGVSVSRNAREVSSEVMDSITATDLAATGTNYTDFSNVTKTSGVIYAGNSAKNASGHIQLRSDKNNSGIVSTYSVLKVKSVKINVGSGNKTIQVYGKNTAYSQATDLYNNSTKGTLIGTLTSTGTITFNGDYLYVGIRSSSGAIYISSVEITYGGESESPTSLANYIMYEDTNGQCNTKFTTAEGYFEGLSKEDRATFMTSEDYVIKTARERFEAWATYLKKSIEYQNNDYVITSGLNSLAKVKQNDSLYLIIIASIALVSVSSIVVVIIIKKKMYH